MIAALRGTVAEKGVAEAILDVGGVSYRVNCSLLTLSKLPPVGASAALRVRTVVREDAFDLYGFLSRAEEELFLLLTSVSHVGPKLATNVLSGLEVEELISALAQGDVARLTRIHGVGKKTAERLVLELKDKAKLLPVEVKGEPPPIGGNADLASALVNMGYKPALADKAAQAAVAASGPEASFQSQLRLALRSLMGAG